MIYDNWSNYLVSELGKVITGKTPSTKNDTFWNGNTMFLTPTDDMEQKRIYSTKRYISDLGLEKVKNNYLPKNTICVSCIGSDLGKVVKLAKPAVTNQQINSIIVNDMFNDDFVYYLMIILGKKMNYLSKTSTAVPIINKSTFSSFKVNAPEKKQQKAIANILSSLDEKIELNNKINKSLEEMAQALYKQWFVDFEFPNEYGKLYKSSGGEMIESELGFIPKGWEVGCIGDYASVKSGYAFKSSHWSESGVGVIKIKDLNDITVDLDGLSHVEKHNSEKAHNFRVSKGDILIAMTGATIGKIGIVPEFKNELYVNQRVGKFFLGDDPIKKLPFIHCLLRDFRILGSIVSAGEGSAQPNISPNGIMNIMIPYKKKVINLFNKTLFDMFDKYLNNINENRVLRNTRDTLLPKLMSGEIEVPIEE